MPRRIWLFHRSYIRRWILGSTWTVFHRVSELLFGECLKRWGRHGFISVLVALRLLPVSFISLHFTSLHSCHPFLMYCELWLFYAPVLQNVFLSKVSFPGPYPMKTRPFGSRGNFSPLPFCQKAIYSSNSLLAVFTLRIVWTMENTAFAVFILCDHLSC